MATKHQKITIPLSDKYNEEERASIAQDVLDFIRDRTQDRNLDKKNRKFPKYSKEYINSTEFKAAGKSSSNVDLTLSESMLSEMDLLNTSKGQITIGFEKGTEENAKADGNIRGTYGKQRGNSSKARDFLGITGKDLKNILRDYPLRSTIADATAAEIRKKTIQSRVEEGLITGELLKLISVKDLDA